jgi:hypothetical protein
MAKHDDSGPGPTGTISLQRKGDVDPAANQTPSICHNWKVRSRIEFFATMWNGELTFPSALFISLGEERTR